MPTLAVFFLLAAVGCSKPNAAVEETSASSASDLTATNGTGLVISQVYGGTGAAGAVWNRDYVELFNRTSSPIPLANLSIHFAGSLSEFSPIGKLPETAIVPPGGYYLVGFAGGLVGADLKVDAGGQGVNILPVNGKIALVRDVPVADPATADAAAQILGCGSVDAGLCNASATPRGRIIDLLGYGLASDHEGDAPAPSSDLTKAIVRKGAGCTDTGKNSADFESAAPTPRSSKSPTHRCGGT